MIQYSFGNVADPGPDAAFQKKQVHGNRCVQVLRAGQDCGNADGFWTTTPNLKMIVATADCVPILLQRFDERAVAALHAGWRGTFARIAEHFFEQLPEGLSNPKEWKAILGPSICASCYEVGDELVAKFKVEFPDIQSDLISPIPKHLNVAEVNRHQLASLGIGTVDVHPDCTRHAVSPAGQHVYRSYRRIGRSPGQNAWIEIVPKD